MLLWRIDPLLGNETAVAMQRSGKDASTAIELLLEMVFSMCSVQRSYLEDNRSDPIEGGRIPPS
jgi:hypothetical protein